MGHGSRSTENPALDAAMRRYADGDDAAFEAVFRGTCERLRRFLRRMARSEALAEDLLQETFLRLHRARGSYSGGPVIPWAFAIARNAFIDHARAMKARKQDQFVDGEEGLLERQAAGPSASAEEESIARQTAWIIDRELGRMTPARREAFELLRYEGLSVSEAAAIVGASETAVKLRAFHAYEQIRAALAAVKPT